MADYEDDLADAFPLSWPVGRPRWTAARLPARFHAGKLQHSALTVAAAVKRVRYELRQLDATRCVISSNLQLRRDGLPISSRVEPEDPGVAVYAIIAGAARVFACDKWDRVADNIAAIAAHLDALRGQLRWGVGDLAQAFAGYRALPAVGAARSWWELLGFDAPPARFDLVRAKFRELIRVQHPDRGGNANQAAETTAAYQEAERYYGVHA